MKTINRGKLLVLSAYLAWGLLPVYWKLLSELPPETVLFQRTIWSVVVLGLILWRRKALPELLEILANRKTAALLAVSSLLLAINWLTYLWAIAEGKMVAASMGYFISPVLSILLGMVFLGESMSRFQKLAVALMCCGILARIVLAGEAPWIALLLAASFSSYALVRKIAQVDAVVGLFVETVVMLLPASMLFYYSSDLSGASLQLWSPDVDTNLLLAISGLVTVLPLLWLVRGAQVVPLSFVGATQYLAPTLMFLMAVTVYGEPIRIYDLVSLPMLWIAAGLFVAEPLLRRLIAGSVPLKSAVT